MTEELEAETREQRADLRPDRRHARRATCASPTAPTRRSTTRRTSRPRCATPSSRWSTCRRRSRRSPGRGSATRADRRARQRPDRPARGRADRRADHRLGAVFDTEGKPLRDTLVEIWQANAAGRYQHRWDRWPAPLDPNFTGAGRCLTDDEGRYRFTTIKPGPYPWGNHYNAWRPAHIHFSLLGRAFTQRLVTQMYFPGDPFFPYDPIFNSVRDERARERMISTLLDPRHRARTGRRPTSSTSTCADPARPRSRRRIDLRDDPIPDGRARTSRSGCRSPTGRTRSRRAPPERSRSRGTIYDGAGDADPRPPDRDLAGRPRRTASPTSTATAARRSSTGFRGFARCGDEDGDGTLRDPDRQAGPAAGSRRRRCRRRTSTCRCSRADMLHRVVTRIYFADEVAGQRRRSGPGARPRRAPRDAARRAPRRRLPLRHPLPGAGRDRLLRDLSATSREETPSI